MSRNHINALLRGLNPGRVEVFDPVHGVIHHFYQNHLAIGARGARGARGADGGGFFSQKAARKREFQGELLVASLLWS